MASEDTLVFLDVFGNTVNSIRGDGSEKKTLFTTGCVCPDGLDFDLTTYARSKNPADVVVWWGNMGAKTPHPEEKDGGDWHSADGFLVRAPLFAGDGAVERVEVTAPRRLIRGMSPYQPPAHLPLITTMKQLAVSQDGRAVFFCDREGHCVKKYNVDTKEVVPVLSSDSLAALADGVTEEEVFASPAKPNSDEDKRRFCVGIALDEAHNRLFFTTKGPTKGGQGCILAAPYNFKRRHLPSITLANTSAAEGVVEPEAVVTVLDNLPEPIDLLLDSKEGYLYWTDRGDGAIGGNSLNRAAVTYDFRTGHPQLGAVELLISGFNETIGLSWAANLEGRMALPKDNKDSLRRYMYVTDLEHLWRCDMQTRTKEAIYTCPPGSMLTGVEVLRLP
ncbi:hypothetical protein NESM_000430000 [Novymonas esmeraldas]|uniref:Uncharacterized protein n=1 Tax=Novymonas esmeraldas TaxID=1808958 RepID=A0AAW0EPG0_9TRYP